MGNEVKTGDRIVYAQSDAGRQFDDRGLVLIPDEVLIVGDDIDLDFAGRLVEDHVCRIVASGGDAIDGGNQEPDAGDQKPEGDRDAGDSAGLSQTMLSAEVVTR